MSGVSGITSQLNSTNACNNCDNSGLIARLQAIEGLNSQQSADLLGLATKFTPLGAAIDQVRGALGLKEDKGQLSETDRIARRALSLAESHEGAIALLRSDVDQIQYILPLMSRETQAAMARANNAYSLSERAYSLAEATSTVVQNHTREIEDLEIQVRSLEDRVARLERNQRGDDGLAERVGSLENWRTGTIAALIAMEIQILRLRSRLDALVLAKGPKGDKGDRGLTGATGKPGPNGLPGKTGERGLPGTKGDRGLTGATGKPGLNGLPGKTGERGLPGTNGTPGAAGKPGTNGYSGTAGTNGTPGAAGKPGTNGLNGKPGLNGTPGTAGTPGTNGAPGTNGTPGQNGTVGNDGKDAEVKFSTITAKKFERCNEKTPVFSTTTVSVIRGTELAESLKLDQLANIEGEKCNECPDNVHGSPEWWEVRPGSNRPQLLLLFSPTGKNRANYQITIPHWTGEKPTPKNPPIKEYKKGSFMAVVHLADTSKLIINAFDKDEAVRVVRRLKGTISGAMLNGSRTNYTELEGSSITKQTMTCRYAVYYPQGQKSKDPLWSVKFDVD